MMTVEIGENEQLATCHCCDRTSSNAHGFIYLDGGAYAVYFAAWSGARRDRGVSLAVAIGEWDEDSTVEQRTCVGMVAREGEHDILFQFIGPSTSPWPDSTLLGPMLEHSSALTHSLKPQFIAIGEAVMNQHPAIRAFLNIAD